MSKCNIIIAPTVIYYLKRVFTEEKVDEAHKVDFCIVGKN